MVSYRSGGDLMKTVKIEETLKNILEIDNQCKNQEKEKEKLRVTYQEKLINEKRKIERKYMKEARGIAKEKRDEVYETFEKEVATIDHETKAEVQRLNFLLENNIDEITDKIFKKILKNI